MANSFEEKADLDLLELKLRFAEKNVGPASYFMAKIKKGDSFVKELPVGSTGQISFVGLDTIIEGNNSVSFQIFLKPNQETSHFLNNGTGELTVFNTEGLIHAEYKKEKTRYSVNLKKPPVRYDSRLLAPIRFMPVEEVAPEVAQAELDQIRIDEFISRDYSDNENKRKVSRNFATELEKIVSVTDLALLHTDSYLLATDCMTANYLGYQDVINIENEVFNDEAKTSKYASFKEFFTDVLDADREVDYANLNCSFE